MECLDITDTIEYFSKCGAIAEVLLRGKGSYYGILLSKITSVLIDIGLIFSLVTGSGENPYGANLIIIYTLWQRIGALFLVIITCPCKKLKNSNNNSQQDNQVTDIDQTEGNETTDDATNYSGDIKSPSVEIVTSTASPLPPVAGIPPSATTDNTITNISKETGNEHDDINVKYSAKYNSYIGAQFNIVDVYGKIMIPKIRDGHCSCKDFCASLPYIIIILIDVILWFLVSEESVWNAWSDWENLVAAYTILSGYIGHLQHCLILFIMPTQITQIRDSCCLRKFLKSFFFILITVETIFLGYMFYIIIDWVTL